LELLGRREEAHRTTAQGNFTTLFDMVRLLQAVTGTRRIPRNTRRGCCLLAPNAWFDDGGGSRRRRSRRLASIGEAMVIHKYLDRSVAEMRAIAENDEQMRLY
jgi:hypothetical protein